MKVVKAVLRYSFTEKYRMLRSKFSIIVKDLKTKTNISINKRISLLMKGFFSYHYILYDLENNDIKNYLSEYQRRKTKFINGQASFILSNKLVCNQILSKYVKTAKIFSIISNGIINSVDDKISIKDIDSLINYLANIEPLILKPNIGTDGGRGIMLVKIVC